MLDDFFEDMQEMQKRMNKMFRNFSEIKSTATDVSETEDSIIIKIDMPGVEKKDIDLVLTENSISVKAKRKKDELEEKKGFFKRERSYSDYNVYTTLPAEVLPETADAQYKNGVLKVKVEKAEKSKEKKKKKIEIN